MGRGRPPKPQDQRDRRNKDTPPDIPLSTETLDKPIRDIPRGPLGRTWLAATRRWWDQWASTPQAVYFVATDWATLELAVMAVDNYYRALANGEHSNAASLIKQIDTMTSKLGGTVYDRIKMRFPVATPEQIEAERAKRAAERKRFEDQAAANAERNARETGAPSDGEVVDARAFFGA